MNYFQNFLRPSVLERDNYSCQVCGKESRSVKYKDMVVHHKDRNGNGSENPNNDPTNLITLCRRCHELEHFDDKHPFGMKEIWENRKNLVKELYQQGMTYREIGKELQVSHQRIYQIIKDK